MIICENLCDYTRLRGGVLNFDTTMKVKYNLIHDPIGQFFRYFKQILGKTMEH